MTVNNAIALAAHRTRHRATLFIMCLGVLVAQVDTSVVNLALSPIGEDLRVPLSVLQWVVDAYNLVYASLLLTAGTLADLYGRRRVFASGVAIFTFGSLICGLAPDETILIAGRAVTGLGAALLLPTSLTILAVTYDDASERAYAIGIWASCYGVALAIGPSLGGVLVEAAGWRSVFLLIMPVSALALIMAFKVLPESRDPQGRHLDLPGQALAILALGALTIAAIEGTQWSARSVALCVGVSLIATALFVAVEARSDGALLPVAILRRRGLCIAAAVAALMTFGMYGMLFLVPLYLQQQRGASIVAAGLELLPLSLVYIVVSQRSGALATRFGPRGVMTAGMGSMGVGLFLLSTISTATCLVAIELDLAVLGIGLGLNTGPVNSVAVASVPAARSGTASGVLNTARMVGATLGVAMLGAAFAVHAGQGSPQAFLTGLHTAFRIGGAGEMVGAILAFCFVWRDALVRSSAGN